MKIEDYGNEIDRDIHTWFSLSYASYMVIPRLFLETMPVEWQHKFVDLVEEMENYLNADDAPSEYQVTARKNGKYIKDKYRDYRRGKVELRKPE